MNGQRDDRARARAALARIRLRRAMARRDRLSDLAGAVGAVVPLALAIALFFVIGEPRQLPDNALVVAFGVLVLMGAIAGVIGGMVVGLSAVMSGALFVLFLPVWAVLHAGRLRAWWLQRAAERLLDRDGRVPAAWAAGSTARRGALARLAASDDALVLSDGAAGAGLAPRPDGPAESCPQCGGARRAVGEGVRRCDHCGRESFVPLPEGTVALGAAAARIAALREGQGAAPRSRRALWRAFLDAHGAELRSGRRGIVRLTLAYGAAALLAWVGERGDVQVLMILGAAGIVLLALPLLAAFVMTARSWFDLRFARFRPGVRAYDRALVSELVALVAHQGRVGLPRVAERLGVSRAHLETLLISLDRLGGAPILRDRERDELVSLCATEIGAAGCPLCGGALEPLPEARIGCAHCGAIGRTGPGHAAIHGRLA